MLQSTILHNTSPEDLINQLVTILKKEIQDLKQNFQPKQPEEYLTRQQVAELLKIDKSTVHNHVKKGVLKQYGIGGKVYYKRSEIEAGMIPLSPLSN
ncbi:excisionase family DNA binding protein [Christiangramia gaetbulicola]|uniref:Excisionase family DNA binding protein n=1 Tax=Christiangramia gaetbulicola TaxID=703340 RepID=A0A2T6AK44_9FLAO|nr:helix-turn-helix domain-containing protein [Christiangramia gaetbulicola]PTX44188.1 excisionase family DNA binding protein [Christiangramia gaetbulicola]